MAPSTAAKKPSDESWREEPIQPKQKAVLEFLKMPVPPTRGGASNLIKAVFESPAGNAHQNLWNASKYELHPDLYPPKPEKEAPRPQSPSLLGRVIKAVIVVAVIYYAVGKYHEHKNSAASGEVAPGHAPATVPPAVAVKQEAQPPQPERTAAGDLIPLESTDGRTVQARVLALTKTTVLIRREDGQTFDLPLEKLTGDSQRRIEEYRAAKRSGAVK
ncbi:hypothetical protein [Prosthecobacter sp.]|uniref:hypothetical protein n=1 Tax=Prosthecobacter sp. TaxID=1965333 RepID=UPI003784C044